MSAGKWILGTLGFVVGGPIGSIIGVLIASLFEKSGSDDQTSSHTSGTSRAQRTTAGDVRVSIIVLIACVIKSDGQVLKSEINYIKPFLLRTFGEAGAKQALLLLKELLKQDIDAKAVAQQIGQHINYSTRLELVHLLLAVANADGEIHALELQTISSIAGYMRIQDADYQSILALYQRRKDTNWAYTALEITPSATNEEVKKAYFEAYKKMIDAEDKMKRLLIEGGYINE